MTLYCFADGALTGVECVNRSPDFMAACRMLDADEVVRVADGEKPNFELKAFMG